MLSIGRTPMYGLISDKKLEAVKIGRRTLIRIESIRRLANEGTAVASEPSLSRGQQHQGHFRGQPVVTHSESYHLGMA